MRCNARSIKQIDPSGSAIFLIVDSYEKRSEIKRDASILYQREVKRFDGNEYYLPLSFALLCVQNRAFLTYTEIQQTVLRYPSARAKRGVTFIFFLSQSKRFNIG